MRILLIEDNEDLAFLARWHLLRSGHTCTSVKSMHDGLDLLASVPFDCLLLDLVLPDGNGLDVLQSLTGGVNERIKVIVQSGNLNGSLRGNPRIKAALQKPYDMSALLQVVETAP